MIRSFVVTAALLGAAAPLLAQTELAPGLALYPAPTGNVLAYADSSGAFVVGPLTATLTRTIQADLSRRTSSPLRYVIVTPNDATRSEGDAGWGALGAFAAVQEMTWARGGGGTRARAAFSEVLKFSLARESIHAVHQPAAHDWADVLVHFERSGVVYLGELLPLDGYPRVDSAHGGTIDSLILALRPWSHNENRLVPAYGPVVGDTAVAGLLAALTAVRDSVRAMKNAGRTLEQVVASRPSASYDARFGHGRVSPDEFVREVYQTVLPR